MDRVIDIGGLAAPEDDYEGKALVIFAVDPGLTTGWSALKVPAGLLGSLGVTRTLARSRWRHGQILRSAGGVGPRAMGRSDSEHVDAILGMAKCIYEEWVWVDEEEEDDSLDDVFVFVFEGFSLRMMSMDTNLLAPVRLLAVLEDRLVTSESDIYVHYQSPADAKNVVTNDRLRRWMMYDEGSGEHARDADRHAILFLRKFAESSALRTALGFDY